MKVLILASFPAPYRVAVFEGMKKFYNADVFFLKDKDQNRSNAFFVKNQSNTYFLLSEQQGRYRYHECLRKIRQYDCIVAYDWYLPEYYLAQVLAWIHKIPYVINCDGALPYQYEKTPFLKDIVKRFFIMRAVRCFASGNYAKNYFLHYGAKECNIVLHNFTSLCAEDILTVPVGPAEKEKTRIALDLEPNKPLVLSIGQFIQRKGFDVLIDAWKDFDWKGQLVIIGGGEEKGNYEKQIASLGLKNIHLLDFLPKEKIAEYYKASDLFVLPTREDIWGLVINEAMAFGLPVIATENCVAAIELVRDNGCIVPVDNAAALSQAMEHYLHLSEDAYLDKAKKSIALIQDYTMDAIAKSHVEEVDSIIAAGKRRR